MEKYITPQELRAIADYCDALQPLWDALVNCPTFGVHMEPAQENTFAFEVFDGNGDLLGNITWGEDGPAFFPEASDDD